MTFTIVAICKDSSPANVPAAVTAAVVSMLPPIHAPVVAGSSPNAVAATGSTKIDGNANTITRLAL